MLAHASNARPVRRVLVHGLVYFGEVFADFMSGDGWEFQYFPDQGLGNLAAMTNALRNCDLVYQIGGRVTIGKFLTATRLLGRHRIVMHWVGSDTLDQRPDADNGKTDSWIRKGIHHWADSEWIRGEVSSLGISSELVPLPSPRVPENPLPLPSEFCVLVYVPSVERSELYGLDSILEVAKRLPQIRFELVGLRDGPIPNEIAPNLRSHRRMPHLDEFYRRASVVWRPARHDGLSWMVLESLGYGRHVLWTYAFPGCIQSTSVSEAAAHLLRLYNLHQGRGLQLNTEGLSFMANSEYSPKSFKPRILSRLEEIIASSC